MATLSQLVARTAERLSMAAGVGVQQYAEDRIAEMIQHKFDMMFDEYWWPQFLAWGTWTLDGSTGVVTTDLTELVKRYEDIRLIFPENSNSTLPQLPVTINPYELSGTVPQYYAPNNTASKVFNVWPLTATGDVIVQHRIKPDTFTAEDTVNFDDQALILGATYDYLEDDGTNPNATQKFQALFESRLKQLKQLLEQSPVSLDPVTRLPNTFEFVALP